MLWATTGVPPGRDPGERDLRHHDTCRSPPFLEGPGRHATGRTRPRIMSMLTLLLIAVGVSADAFAVAIGKGLQMRTFRPRHAAAVAVTFGVFQGAMPLIGYLLGSGLERYITRIDHWIAFGLLSLVGAKMIREASQPQSLEHHAPQHSVAGLARELAALGFATSIDALAVGIGFAFLDVNIIAAAGLIGVTTFVLSYAGVAIGHRAGARWRRPAEFAGGVILIAIGIRILLDHLGVL